jgi:hypothetical protein
MRIRNNSDKQKIAQLIAKLQESAIMLLFHSYEKQKKNGKSVKKSFEKHNKPLGMLHLFR